LAQSLVGVVCMRLLAHAGGHGRRCAVEVLVANDAVRNVIRDGKSHQLRNVISTSRQAGMQTLEADLTDLVARREVTLEHARLATQRPGELRSAETALT
jgi:twitching motility protein PilT